MLWQALRKRSPGWFPEVATGPYLLDFYCPSAMLAVEVDGGSHYGQQRAAADARRDQWHSRQEIETLRISARHIERDLPGPVSIIDQRVAARLAQLDATPTGASTWAPRTVPTQLSTGTPKRRARRSSRRGRPSWLVIARMLLVAMVLVVSAGLIWDFLCLHTAYGAAVNWLVHQVIHVPTPPTKDGQLGPVQQIDSSGQGPHGRTSTATTTAHNQLSASREPSGASARLRGALAGPGPA